MWRQTKSRLIRFRAVVALLPVVALLSVHDGLAQPMMMDPSQMSGIPRPDPAVPSATVTVRLIRGELANRVTDTAVELVSQAEPDKPPRSVKTDAEGRATFPDLPSAIYTARSSLDGQTLTSQPIEVQPSPAPGVRVMLVFPKSVADQQQELGRPDGKARVDLKAAAGTLVVKTVDASGQPLSGLRVTLMRANRDSEKVDQLPPQTTSAEGIVRYSDMPTGGTTGYMASVQKDGSDQRSQPFQLAVDHGSIVALTILNVSRDLNQLRIGQGSHAIFEPQDDSVQVMENLILQNPLPQPMDPGPAGLRIPLAEGALSAQPLPGGPPSLTIDASREGAPAAVWKGPIPSGQTMVSVAFILKQRGSLTFRQATSLKYEGLRVGIAKLPDLHVEGIRDVEERKLNGRDFIVASAIVPSPGGIIELTLDGLPRDFYLLRIAAALLALLIALAFTYVAVYGPSTDDEQVTAAQRQKQMTRREQLLDELMRLESPEGTAAATSAKSKKRTPAQVRSELEELYRKLDESDGP